MNTTIEAPENISREIFPAYKLHQLPDATFVPELPVALCWPWHKNPRKAFEEAALEELAASIRQDGVQQPIVVNVRQGYSQAFIVMGERRYLASLRAGKETIPAIVRRELDDRTCLRLAIAENMRRNDLNPMEQAHAYQALQDEGLRQQEIATELGVNQSTISNTLRLLKLPQTVQTLVIEGKLSASHARALLRFEEFPAIIEAIAERAVAQGVSAKSLEEGVPFYRGLIDDGLVKLLHYNALFNVDTVCANCPLGARKLIGQGGSVCLRPDHYAELEAQGRAEREARNKAHEEEEQRRRERFAAVVGSNGLNVSKNGSEMNQSDGNVQAVDTSASERSGGWTDLPRLSDLPSGHYRSIRTVPPPGCTPECPCRRQALDYRGQVCDICVDYERYDKLETEKAKAEQKAKKERMGALQEEISAARPTGIDCRALAVLLWNPLRQANGNVKKALASTYPNAGLTDLFERAQRYGFDDCEAYEALVKLEPLALQNLALEALLRQDVYQAAQPGSYRADLARVNWFLRKETPSNTSANISREMSEGESDEAAAVAAEAEPEGQAQFCDACEDEIAKDVLGAGVALSVDFGDSAVERLESGVLVVTRNDYEWTFCPECAPAIRVCERCGRLGPEGVDIERGESLQFRDGICDVCVDAGEEQEWEDPACDACGQRAIRRSERCGAGCSC